MNVLLHAPRHWLGVTMLALCAGAPAVAAEPFVGPTLGQLQQFNADWQLPHEGKPQGVPASYDWARKGRITSGNRRPPGFSALTGWGQAFWLDRFDGTAPLLQVRQHQTLACLEPDRRWVRLQSGAIAGAAFRPDFANNTAKPPERFTLEGDRAVISFAANEAFHFWPKSGRAELPSDNLCGLLVLLEAKASARNGSEPVASGSTGLLIGLGADHWLDRKAGWDNYKTNKDVGVGRLRAVGWSWAWYGLSTATDADLAQLVKAGFTDLSSR